MDVEAIHTADTMKMGFNSNQSRNLEAEEREKMKNEGEKWILKSFNPCDCLPWNVYITYHFRMGIKVDQFFLFDFVRSEEKDKQNHFRGNAFHLFASAITYKKMNGRILCDQVLVYRPSRTERQRQICKLHRFDSSHVVVRESQPWIRVFDANKRRFIQFSNRLVSGARRIPRSI